MAEDVTTTVKVTVLPQRLNIKTNFLWMPTCLEIFRLVQWT